MVIIKDIERADTKSTTPLLQLEHRTKEDLEEILRQVDPDAYIDDSEREVLFDPSRDLYLPLVYPFGESTRGMEIWSIILA